MDRAKEGAVGGNGLVDGWIGKDGPPLGVLWKLWLAD